MNLYGIRYSWKCWLDMSSQLNFFHEKENDTDPNGTYLRAEICK
jgi:hypothetical protein